MNHLQFYSKFHLNFLHQVSSHRTHHFFPSLISSSGVSFRSSCVKFALASLFVMTDAARELDALIELVHNSSLFSFVPHFADHETWCSGHHWRANCSNNGTSRSGCGGEKYSYFIADNFSLIKVARMCMFKTTSVGIFFFFAALFLMPSLRLGVKPRMLPNKNFLARTIVNTDNTNQGQSFSSLIVPYLQLFAVQLSSIVSWNSLLRRLVRGAEAEEIRITFVDLVLVIEVATDMSLTTETVPHLLGEITLVSRKREAATIVTATLVVILLVVAPLVDLPDLVLLALALTPVLAPAHRHRAIWKGGGRYRPNSLPNALASINLESYLALLRFRN